MLTDEINEIRYHIDVTHDSSNFRSDMFFSSYCPKAAHKHYEKMKKKYGKKRIKTTRQIITSTIELISDNILREKAGLPAILSSESPQ